MTFDSLADQAAYQAAPAASGVHRAAAATLWERVLVYDIADFA